MNNDTEFKYFMKFPVEVREMIWKEALPKYQVVKIDNAGSHRGGSSFWTHEDAPFDQAFIAKASYAIPAPLHTNLESRTVAKRNYDLAFSEQLGGNPIYFNFDTDTIYSWRMRARWLLSEAGSLGISQPAPGLQVLEIGVCC